MTSIRVISFGDSILWGAWDTEGGWFDRLRRQFGSLECKLYNLGISSETTSDLIVRFKAEAAARLKKADPGDRAIVIFAIGVNDALQIFGHDEPVVPLKVFKNNLRLLVKLAHAVADEVMFVGLTPVDEKRTVPIPWHTSKSYRNSNIKIYDSAIRELCKEKHLIFIDIFGEWVNTNYAALLKDGLHPNSTGHRKIAVAVGKSLLKSGLLACVNL
jgi:lysophospholipase L1-like esterase